MRVNSLTINDTQDQFTTSVVSATGEEMVTVVGKSHFTGNQTSDHQKAQAKAHSVVLLQQAIAALQS